MRAGEERAEFSFCFCLFNMVNMGTINIGEKLQTIIYHGGILQKISKSEKMLHCLFHSYLILPFIIFGFAFIRQGWKDI